MACNNFKAFFVFVGYYQKALRYTKGNDNADYEEGVASEKKMTKEQRKKARLAAKEVKRAEALLKAAEKKAQEENEKKERISRAKVKEQAIVIENAPLGVESGHASGCFVIAVNTGPLPDHVLMDSGADILYHSMTELSENIKDILNR